MFLLNDRVLPLDTAFSHAGVSYPANWLRLASPEEREAIGITEVVEQPRPDDRFYWVSGPNEDGSWAATPKDLDGLKPTWAAQMRQTAWTLLTPSDWMVVRHIEEGVEIPADWKAWRSSVRTTTGAAVAALEAATDVEELVAAVTSVEWPTSPDAQPLTPVEPPTE